LKRYFGILCLILLGLVLALPAQENAAQEFKPAGVMINNQFIYPGDTLLNLLGVAGFPDNLLAMRGQEPKDDYIKLVYHSYRLSFNIASNQDNLVMGILIQGNQVKTQNLPFKIGSSLPEVVAQWGEPDTTQNNIIGYPMRGAIIMTDEAGKINNIYLYVPAKVEEDSSGSAS